MLAGCGAVGIGKCGADENEPFSLCVIVKVWSESGESKRKCYRYSQRCGAYDPNEIFHFVCGRAICSAPLSVRSPSSTLAHVRLRTFSSLPSHPSPERHPFFSSSFPSFPRGRR